ncbi:hypothetical protein [Helicobacter rodentium]|uniref:hypothetical protein n=2 Tax=Helicobacter rodentium TaxID=59617 RepID=UPI0023F47125|nr:hypothetical protein [Helicobacter rodentium]
MTKFYTWQKVQEGLCPVGLNTQDLQEDCVKTYCLDSKKFLSAITLEESAFVEFEAMQNPSIKLTKKSESEFIKLRNKTEQYAREQECLNDVKVLRLNELNQSFNALIENALGEAVPPTEMLTWEAQERESNAFLNSNPRNESLAPTMVGIATARGVDLEILCQKCIEKSEKYRLLSATMIGKRQKFQDAIESAKTQEEVWNVEFAWA